MSRGLRSDSLILLSHQDQPAQVLYGNARQDQCIGGNETRQAHFQERCKGCQRLYPQRCATRMGGKRPHHWLTATVHEVEWAGACAVPACLIGSRMAAESPVRAGVAAWRGR